MEVTIERLRTIKNQDSKPKAKKMTSLSDLKPNALSITVTEVPVDDVAEEDDTYFSDYDGYFSDEEEKKKPVVVLKPEETVEEENGKTMDMVYKDYRSLQAYTVHVDGHRILTLVTYSNAIASRWIKEVLRCSRKKKGHGGDEIVVGVSIDRENLYYEKGGLKDTRYDIVQLCVGSQCLIFEDPESYKCPLRDLFADRRVVAAGVNIHAITKKLSKDLDIEFTNVLDLNETTEKLFEDFKEAYQLNMKKYDLDTLGMMVLGQSWYIDRPQTKVAWTAPNYRYNWYCGWLGMEKVKYATYDAYMNYMIGARLLEIKKVKKSVASAGKKKNKKKDEFYGALIRAVDKCVLW